MDARLEIKRANADTKCANCGWWQGGEGPSGPCELHNVKTLDLAVCTGWRTADITQQVLPPEKGE